MYMNIIYLYEAFAMSASTLCLATCYILYEVHSNIQQRSCVYICVSSKRYAYLPMCEPIETFSLENMHIFQAELY